MRVQGNLHRIALALTVLGVPALGQVRSGSGIDTKSPVNKPPVRRQFYTAEIKITTVQTLANGTAITSESTELHVMDAQNRVLFSRTSMVPVGDRQETASNGYIDDPVECTRTDWTSQSMVASVIKLPFENQRHGCWESDSGRIHMEYGTGQPSKPAPDASGGEGGTLPAHAPAAMPDPPVTSTQDLGTAIIQGIEVHGWRSTSTIPAGQIGNDRPMTHVNESWIAPGFEYPLRAVDDDPQSGKTISELVSVDLNEPPISAFQPPDGYTVKVEELRQVPCPQPGMPWQR